MGLLPPPMMPLPDSPVEYWQQYYAAMYKMQVRTAVKFRLLAIVVGLGVGCGIALLALVR